MIFADSKLLNFAASQFKTSALDLGPFKKTTQSHVRLLKLREKVYLNIHGFTFVIGGINSWQRCREKNIYLRMTIIIICI